MGLGADVSGDGDVEAVGLLLGLSTVPLPAAGGEVAPSPGWADVPGRGAVEELDVVAGPVPVALALGDGISWPPPSSAT
ncbi:MAG: hypothetical protein QOE01_111, partial [Actinomycetota bacterium]|nr:hypothetical protein [Actinomycetota bacterium]